MGRLLDMSKVYLLQHSYEYEVDQDNWKEVFITLDNSIQN